MALKISLAGDLGSGKSTVSNILMGELGAEYYGTGKIARELAESMGMDIAALNIYMEDHPEMDYEFDRRLVNLSDDPRTLIIDSRMAWHFTRGTLKIYLSTDPETSAVRIMRAGRSSEQFATVEEAAERIRARKESERKRYGELYGVDCKDLGNYNLVIDTTYASPEETCEAILATIPAWEADSEVRACYVCSRRLRYPDDAPDAEAVARISSAVERGEDTPPVEVCYRDDTFYVMGGAEVALAYALCEAPLVPCRLVDGSPDPTAFVKMEDNLS